MDMMEYRTWHTDDVSLAILDTLREEDLDTVAQELEHDTEFLKAWGPFQSADPDIDEIQVHAWARNRIIARAAFSSGIVFADSTIKLDKPLPETVAQAIAGDLVRLHVPHPCFGETRFETDQGDDRSMLRLDIVSHVDLGYDPGRGLAEAVAARRPIA